MPADLPPSETGLANLFAKTLLVLYAGLLAFGSGKAHAAPVPGTPAALDGDLVARLQRLRYRPQLVLKLNRTNPLAS